MTFLNSLKKWFYTNNSSAAGSAARIPLLDASGNAVGSDTYNAIAQIVRQELATILSGADQGTSGTKFPSIASGVLGSTTAASLALVLSGLATPIALTLIGDGTDEILELCKRYWNTMESNRIVFVRANSTTTSFGFILKGSMGSGVGIIKMLKGASGEVISYCKKYNSDDWIACDF